MLYSKALCEYYKLDILQLASFEILYIYIYIYIYINAKYIIILKYQIIIKFSIS